MGKNGYDPEKEQTAAQTHELNRQELLSPAEELEAGEAAEETLLDEWALAFRRRGVAGEVAMLLAMDAREVLAARDRAACAPGGEADGRERTASESLRVMTIRLVQAPKPRFSAGCLILAMGWEHKGITSSNAWADRQHVSHELAADEVEEWQRVMKLPRNKWQKSEAAKASYGETNGKQRQG